VLQGAAVAALAERFLTRPRTWRPVVAGVLTAMALLVAADGLRAVSPHRVVLDGVTTPDGAVVQDETLHIRRADR
jgi:hypothetical protein